MLLLLFFAVTAHASTRPRYGGTLRIELHERIASLDPRQWVAGSSSAASAEKLAALVFDRLITMDDFGRPQPQLAIAWRHDDDYKRWQFTLRSAVRFHDGALMTAGEVAGALQALLGSERQIIAAGEVVVVQSGNPMPDLLEELASGRYFIVRTQGHGLPSGTGPFRIVEWSGVPRTRSTAGSSRTDSGLSRTVFGANQDFWSGRPFLDLVEVTMGVSSQNQFQDLQLGKVDLTELSPDQVRRASQAGLRTWSSAPVELFAIVFDKEASIDSRIRQALSLSVDRAAITNVLLQKLGEPAGGILPQWLSGYAFLFSTPADTQSAQQLRTTTRTVGAASVKPLRLGVGDDDDTVRLIAERVALNARQAGLAIQVIARGEADARLIRWRLDSIAAPAVLLDLTRALDLSDESAATLKKISSNDPEQTYAAERAIIENYRVIPLVYLPETIGLGPAVRNWMPRRWAEWHLEDVWLDLQTPAPVNPSGAGTAGARP
ncbi:MAG TPA: ABC transporter substrate-binding protein [Candidatus Dormibacteraeota bacterium]|nr:ABC transporter substrate-binding protein [Candidatus Dormibacteraeota bacterium]